MRQPVQGLLMRQVSVGSKTDNRTRGEFAQALVLDDLALSKREVLQLWQPFQVELQDLDWEYIEQAAYGNQAHNRQEGHNGQ